jgi:hypothetical protein
MASVARIVNELAPRVQHASATSRARKEIPVRNIVVVTFSEPSTAYQAMSVLQEQDEFGRLSLYAAAVVERDAGGKPSVRDYTDRMALRESPHGLIGRMIDGLKRIDYSVDIATRIPAGATGLMAEVGEYATEVIDTSMGALGGTVYRQTTDEVGAAFKAAEHASMVAQEQEDRTEQLRRSQESERKHAEAHNERLDRAEQRLDRLERWLDGQKMPVPSYPASTAQSAGSSAGGQG